MSPPSAAQYKSGGGRSGTCDESKLTPVSTKISSWSQVSKGGLFGGADEAALQKALLASGPITIGINASPMQRYKGGIDNPLFCLKSSLDHAVLVVGYGSEGGKDYWKIKKRVARPPEPWPRRTPWSLRALAPWAAARPPLTAARDATAARGIPIGARMATTASSVARTSADWPTTPSTRRRKNEKLKTSRAQSQSELGGAVCLKSRHVMERWCRRSSACIRSVPATARRLSRATVRLISGEPQV